MTPGPTQILIIILLILIVFGAGRVPTIMENLAKGINSFKKGLKEGEIDKPLLEEDRKEDEKAKEEE